MPLPNEQVESVLVHPNEYDTYSVANRMARRLLENDKYLESIRDMLEVDVYTAATTGQLYFTTVGSYKQVVIPHTLATNYPVVTLVDSTGVLKTLAGVQYDSGQVTVTVASSPWPSSTVVWHCRLS